MGVPHLKKKKFYDFLFDFLLKEEKNNGAKWPFYKNV